MSTATATPVGEVAVLHAQAQAVHGTLRANTKGLTQEDSLVQPEPGGNCLNWVVGHLLSVYDNVLPLFGQDPVLGKEALSRYRRGSAPLTDPAEALPLDTLLRAWDEAASRIEAGLATLTTERLDARAPFSPRNDPNETVRSLLSMVIFHQAYHAGQTGLLRRLAGKEGAVR